MYCRTERVKKIICRAPVISEDRKKNVQEEQEEHIGKREVQKCKRGGMGNIQKDYNRTARNKLGSIEKKIKKIHTDPYKCRRGRIH